jgi:hypothetical protein
MFPLWYKQNLLLEVLNNERRTRHRDLKNDGRKNRKFEPGDIVIVRKQVQSKASEGRPAKLVLRSKGPYRVLEPAGDFSYYVQRIPAVQEVTRRKGKKMKEMAFRMERLPSTVVIHKRVDTLDTRFAKMEQDLADRPLEHTLGFIDFGKYQKADANSDHAFVKVNDMWDEQVDEHESSESEDEPITPEPTEQVLGDPAAPTAIQDRHQAAAAPDAIQDRHQAVRIRSRRGPSRRHNPVTMIQPVTRKQILTQLWTQTETSKDKLFFIHEKETGQIQAQWYLVQVDLDETRRRNAQNLGEYHVRWMIKNEPQSKTTKTRNCAFWPLIRELLPNGYFGAIVMFRPQKALTILEKKSYKYAWYQREINLAEGKLHGPFDYGKNFTIEDEHWDALKQATNKPDIHVDISDINRIVPLKANKR